MSISNYIREDLTQRLRTGQELPCQLTIDSLSEMYNVSFTPVRVAVAGLIDDGLLAKGANRRLVIPQQSQCSEAAVKLPEAEVKPPEPPRDLFGVLSGDLIRLSLEGNQIYLREEVTAEKYGVSRSMIRNVLHRLAGEGILDHIPRRGWRLRPFRQEDLQSYVHVRESLELTALNLSLPKLDQTKLTEILDKNVFPGESDQSPVIDESLHSYLIETSGNQYIKEFFERQGRYYRLLFQWEDRDLAAAMETVRQHREILTFLLNKNWVAARKSLSRHILTNHPVLNRIR